MHTFDRKFIVLFSLKRKKASNAFDATLMKHITHSAQWAELESNETLSNIDRTYAGCSGMIQRPQNTIAGNPIK